MSILFPTIKVISKDLKILSIKNFYNINFLKRRKINKILEKNYKKYRYERVGFNFELHDEDDKFFYNLKRKIIKKTINIFGDMEFNSPQDISCWCYRSTKSDHIRVFHNHMNTSIINTVYYYQVNKNDSISFLDNEGNEFFHNLDCGELLIFPNNIIHAPDEPQGNKTRYSINIELVPKNMRAEEIFNLRLFN